MSRRTAPLAVIILAVFAVAGCGNPPDPVTPGANVNAGPNAVFATLMQRPDIDQATQHYEQMGSEIRRALAQAIPELSSWQQDGDVLNSGCGAECKTAAGSRSAPRRTPVSTWRSPAI
ncbi:MAG TPA: LppA family lipoprotein [Pseudonocardiaceae bacterium]